MEASSDEKILAWCRRLTCLKWQVQNRHAHMAVCRMSHEPLRNFERLLTPRTGLCSFETLQKSVSDDCGQLFFSTTLFLFLGGPQQYRYHLWTKNNKKKVLRISLLLNFVKKLLRFCWKCRFFFCKMSSNISKFFWYFAQVKWHFARILWVERWESALIL